MSETSTAGPAPRARGRRRGARGGGHGRADRRRAAPISRRGGGWYHDRDGALQRGLRPVSRRWAPAPPATTGGAGAAAGATTVAAGRTCRGPAAARSRGSPSGGVRRLGERGEPGDVGRAARGPGCRSPGARSAGRGRRTPMSIARELRELGQPDGGVGPAARPDPVPGPRRDAGRRRGVAPAPGPQPGAPVHVQFQIHVTGAGAAPAGHPRRPGLVDRPVVAGTEDADVDVDVRRRRCRTPALPAPRAPAGRAPPPAASTGTPAGRRPACRRRCRPPRRARSGRSQPGRGSGGSAGAGVSGGRRGARRPDLRVAARAPRAARAKAGDRRLRGRLRAPRRWVGRRIGRRPSRRAPAVGGRAAAVAADGAAGGSTAGGRPRFAPFSDTPSLLRTRNFRRDLAPRFRGSIGDRGGVCGCIRQRDTALISRRRERNIAVRDARAEPPPASLRPAAMSVLILCERRGVRLMMRHRGTTT